MLKNSKYLNPEFTAELAKKELYDSLKILNSIKTPLVSILGSHLTKEEDPEFIKCFNITKQIVKSGYGIITGGGPGIMLAANKAALISNGISVGFKEKLLVKEQFVEDNFTHQYSFELMFVRRFAIAIKSSALVFFPGGLGTLNELFEYLTLIQTNICDKVPVILVNSEYWNGLISWIKNQLEYRNYLEPEHRIDDLVNIADDVNSIIKIIVSTKNSKKNN